MIFRNPLRRWRILIFAFIGAMLSLAFLFGLWPHKFDPDRDSLSPDLIVRMSCPGTTAPTDEFWEHALIRLGFRPLNRPALARKYGIYDPEGGQDISGLGPGDRILAVHSFQHIALVDIDTLSAPPTVHDIQLETAIRTITEQMKCNIESVRTNENKLQALPFFLRIVRIHKTWYADAAALERR